MKTNLWDFRALGSAGALTALSPWLLWFPQFLAHHLIKVCSRFRDEDALYLNPLEGGRDHPWRRKEEKKRKTHFWHSSKSLIVSSAWKVSKCMRKKSSNDRMSQSINQLTNIWISQSLNQSINQSINISINHSINSSSISQSITHSMNEWMNESFDQSIN